MTQEIKLVEDEIVITNKQDATEYINKKLMEIELIKQNITRQIEEINAIKIELSDLI